MTKTPNHQPPAVDFRARVAAHFQALGGYLWLDSPHHGEEFAGISRIDAPHWPGWRAIDLAKQRGEKQGEVFPRNAQESELLHVLVEAFYAGIYPWGRSPRTILAKLVICGQVIAKKNSRASRGGYTVPSAAYKAWEAGALEQLNLYTLGRIPTITGPVSIVVDIYRRTHHDYDVDNMGTSVLDALEAARVIVNDKATVVPWVLSRHAGKDADNPRAIITIVDGDIGSIGGLA